MPNTFYHQGAAFNVGSVHGDLNSHQTHINVIQREEEPICFRYQVPVEGFIGRSAELRFLNDVIRRNDQKRLRQIIVVSGLGGSGKTQLVKKFVEENKDFYGNLVWINSHEHWLIQDEFKILARDYLNVALKVMGEEKHFRSLVEEVFRKLSKFRTLIVFDNVDKKENMEFVLKIGTMGVAPHIVITSRIQEWSESIYQIKLKVFSAEDSLEYVSQKLDGSEGNDSVEDKMKLVETLHYFPIALRQATAHINYHRRQDSYEIGNYLADFKTHREQILASDFFRKDPLNQYTETTLTTWNVTMDLIKNMGTIGEFAYGILCIIAYFHPVQIRRDIFFSIGNLSIEPAVVRNTVKSAVGLLINYSMVDSSEQQSLLSIHTLVQQVIKIKLAKDDNSEERTLREAIRLILKMSKHPRFYECHEHAISVCLSSFKFKALIYEFPTFSETILQSLNDIKKCFRAVAFGNEILPHLSNVLGENHPQILLNKFYIAQSLYDLGKYSEALRLFEEVLEKQEKTSDRSNQLELNQEIFLTKFNIAESYYRMEKYSDAIALFDELLHLQKHIFTVEILRNVIKFRVAVSHHYLGRHSETIRIFEEMFEEQKNNSVDDKEHQFHTSCFVGYAYRYLYKNKEALQIFEELLEKQKMVSGFDHPCTWETKSSIADLYAVLGKNIDALQIHEEILEKRSSILGTDHPKTLDSKYKIAQLYGDLGRHSDALRLWEEILGKQKRMLGEHHPDTFSSESRLVKMYVELGKCSEALEMLHGIFVQRKNVFGDLHTETLDVEFQIAESYSNMGKNMQALRMFENILDKQKATLGEYHEDTLITSSRIAEEYHDLCKNREAIEKFEELLTKQKKVLGENHILTIISAIQLARSLYVLCKYSDALLILKGSAEKVEKKFAEYNIVGSGALFAKFSMAKVYRKMGKHSQALQIFAEILETQKSTLKEDEPDALDDVYILAMCYRSLYKHAEALEIFEDVYAKWKIKFGEDHRDTVRCKFSISKSYSDLGKHSEALRLFEEVLETEKRMLGDDHPETLLTKSRVAETYRDLGKRSEALRMFAEVLEKRKQILGEDHPHTLLSESRIAEIDKLIHAASVVRYIYFAVALIACGIAFIYAVRSY